MRVLHVMECTIGGTRRHLVDVTAGQVDLGLDVHVVAATVRAPDFEEDLRALEGRGVHVTRLPMARAIRPRLDLTHLVFLREHLRRIEPDVVHTHSSKAGALGRLASMQTGIGARVHTPHTFAFLFEAEFSRPKRALFRAIERALSAETQALVAVSPSEARTFVDSGIVESSRVRVVPNGIDSAPWSGARPSVRSVLGLRDDRPLAAVVGLLNVAKGQDIALDALAQPGLAGLQIVIVGDGELESVLKQRAARLGLEDRVRFLGFRRDVPELLAAADFLLLPSRWEGMPYVVLEAMASALPVVATPVDGARDLVEDGVTGLLARAIDAHALAECLRDVLALAPTERRAMGERGRARLASQFSARSMVEGLVAVYHEVA